MTTERAGAVAAEALHFLASDDDRVVRFISLTGTDPATIKARLRDDAFLAGVLAHVLQDEKLLVEFAEHAGLPSEEPASAYFTLTGEFHG